MLVMVIFAQRKGATGANGGGAERRRTLRASVLHPTLPGRLRAPNPADNRTRKRASTGWDRARNKAPWSGRGSWATRTRENAAVERRRARALPHWAHDAPAS